MAFFRQKLNVEQFPASIRAKWCLPLLDEGYVPFPKRLVRCLDNVLPQPLGLPHLRVILAVEDFKRDGQMRLPSIQFLAHLAGRKEKEFGARLKDLKKEGLVITKGTEEAIDVSFTPLFEKAVALTDET